MKHNPGNWKNRFVRVRKSNRGQSTVEFAFVAILFFELMFGIIDIGRLFFVELTLQNAMRQAGRYAVTGSHLPDPSNPGKYLTRAASIIQIAQNAAVGTIISNPQITPPDGGGPDATVNISLTSSLTLFTPLIGQFFGTNGVYTFTVSTTFRNEPFPPGQTS